MPSPTIVFGESEDSIATVVKALSLRLRHRPTVHKKVKISDYSTHSFTATVRDTTSETGERSVEVSIDASNGNVRVYSSLEGGRYIGLDLATRALGYNQVPILQR